VNFFSWKRTDFKVNQVEAREKAVQNKRLTPLPWDEGNVASHHLEVLVGKIDYLLLCLL
jgi:hypothetical protein